MDAEKGEGRDLAQRYQVKGYPTFILADARGEPFDRWMGYRRARFLKTLPVALADPTPIEAKRRRFAASPEARDAAALARCESSLTDYAGAMHYYRKAQELGWSAGADYSLELFEASYRAMGMKDGPTFEEVGAAADAVMAAPRASPADLLGVALLMSGAARRQERPELAAPYLSAAIGRCEGAADSTMQQDLAEVRALHALYVEKDPAKAVAVKKESSPKGWTEDANQLNGFAWWCFENRVALEEARWFAERGAELAAPGKQRGQLLDTLAEIENALGDPARAAETMRRAMTENPQDKYYPKQLDRFEKLAAQKN